MSVPGAAGHRRSPLFWVLMTVLVVVPLLEIFVIGGSVHVIGGLWTLGMLLASGLLGGYLIRLEGPKAWRALVSAFGQGRIPTGELADGALVLAGGLMLLMPGFVTDVLGLLMILPATRPVFGKIAVSVLTNKAKASIPGNFGQQASASHASNDPRDVVVDGDVIEVNPDQIER